MMEKESKSVQKTPVAALHRIVFCFPMAKGLFFAADADSQAMAQDFEAIKDMQLFANRLRAATTPAAGTARPRGLFLRRAAQEGWRTVDIGSCVWLLRPTLDAVFAWDQDARGYVLDQISLPPKHGYLHISLSERSLYAPAYGGPMPRRCPPNLGAKATAMYCLASSRYPSLFDCCVTSS